MVETSFSADGRMVLTYRFSTPVAVNNLGRFPANSDKRWGILNWAQWLPDADAAVAVDVLDENGSVLAAQVPHRSAGSVQVEGVSFDVRGVRLDEFKELQGRNIIVRFGLSMINRSPVIRFITFGFRTIT